MARATLVGVTLYVAIDVALVFLRPGLSVLHNAESDYGAAGGWAWLMDVNFLLRLLLSLTLVSSLAAANHTSRRLTAALVLMTVWALTSGLLAAFPDDPVGAPVHTTGRVHLTLATIAFLALLTGTILATSVLRRQPLWQKIRLVLLALSWGAVVPLLLLGHVGFRQNSLGGLYEKVFLAMELTWFVLAAVPIARSHAPGRADALDHRPAASELRGR